MHDKPFRLQYRGPCMPAYGTPVIEPLDSFMSSFEEWGTADHIARGPQDS
jgi:hypothetical protein